jgi:hypothetical protein
LLKHAQALASTTTGRLWRLIAWSSDHGTLHKIGRLAMVRVPQPLMLENKKNNRGLFGVTTMQKVYSAVPEIS